MAIEITYRRTRRLSMRIVKNGDVHVSVPIGVPKREVEKFIEEHRDWIASIGRNSGPSSTTDCRSRLGRRLMRLCSGSKRWWSP